MAYYYRSRSSSSFFDAFSLSPLPYPVLIILGVLSIFLGISWFFSYDDAMETAEETFGWVLFATPVLLLLLARWLSSMEESGSFFAMSPWDRRRRTHHLPSEGSSPWAVAALIGVLLVLVQYQSAFREGWLI